MADVAVISPDEAGRDFWHVDMYKSASDWDYWDWDCGPSVDGWVTTKKGATEAEARALAEEHFPGAEIRVVLDEDEDTE